MIQLKTANAALCPLTLSLNYLQSLHAYRVVNANQLEPLTTFPTYGSLLGILVPAGAGELLIRAEPVLPLWSRLGALSGLILIISVFVMMCFGQAIKLKSREYLPTFAFMFGLLLLLVCLYRPALSGAFLDVDDTQYILKNAAVTSSSSPLGFWTQLNQIDYWPVHYSILWLFWRIFEADPHPYHSANLLLHAANATLFYFILRRYRIRHAAWGALFFAIHPVQVPAVAWIFQLKTVLAATFFLISYYLYLLFDTKPLSQKRTILLYAASLLAFILAVLTKSSTAMLPICLVFHHLYKKETTYQRMARRILPFAVASIAVTSVSWYVNAQNILHAREGFWKWHPTWAERILLVGKNSWFYLSKLFFPSRLFFVYPWESSDPASLLSYIPLVALLGALLGMLFLLRRRFMPATLFGTGFYLINLLPALGLVDIPFMRFSLVADHWQYLASFGVFALVAASLSLVPKRFGNSPVILSCSLIALALGALTWDRAHAFEDSEALWLNDLKLLPTSATALYNLGVVYSEKGLSREAEAAYLKSLEADPHQSSAEINLAQILISKNQPVEAERHYRNVISYDRGNLSVHFDLAVLLQSTGRLSEALDEFDEALIRQPGYPDALSNKCSIFYQLHRLREAGETCRLLVSAHPEHFPGLINLAAVLMAEERPEDALAAYQDALKLNPSSHLALLKIGKLALQLGHREQARSAFHALLQLDPSQADARNGLAALKDAPP